MGILKIPTPNLSEKELREMAESTQKVLNKLEEYKQKFGTDICTEFLPMTDNEIIRNLDKCIKRNKKWEGYIVPMVDDEDFI